MFADALSKKAAPKELLQNVLSMGRSENFSVNQDRRQEEHCC